MIDFNKLNTENTIDTLINPRDLFSALPHKDSSFTYNPTTVYFSKKKQAQILRDKLNSGEVIL